MELSVVLVLLVGLFGIASSQTGCGTGGTCSTLYNEACPVDTSNELSCMQSQESCDQPIESPTNANFQCYDTCVEGFMFDPARPLRCCADNILTEQIAATVDPNYVILRIYAPNMPDVDDYRHNSLCSYDLRCPDNFDLHYSLVEYDIEQPSNPSDDCLDFLRFHFTATGMNVDADVCGDDDSRPVPAFVRTGFHGVSPLNVEFRSNRVFNGQGFFVAVTCINPAPFREARQVGLQQRDDCMPSQSLPGRRLGKKKREVEAKMDIENVFHWRQGRSFRVPWVAVTVSRVLKYVDNTLIVEEKGYVVHKFKGIKVLQVYNRIEGYLTFYGSSSPHGRTFPGYGKLHIGSGIAYYIQTIVDPRFLLSEEEDEIVSKLHSELFRRQAFDDERFFFGSPNATTVDDPIVNCEINILANLNIRSCTAVVRAAADYFLRKDPFRDVCQRQGYPG